MAGALPANRDARQQAVEFPLTGVATDPAAILPLNTTRRMHQLVREFTIRCKNEET